MLLQVIVLERNRRVALPKNDQIWPKIGILWSIWARPCRLLWCPVGGSFGGCGARAVSRKTPIYSIIYIFFFFFNGHWSIFSYIYLTDLSLLADNTVHISSIPVLPLHESIVMMVKNVWLIVILWSALYNCAIPWNLILSTQTHPERGGGEVALMHCHQHTINNS